MYTSCAVSLVATLGPHVEIRETADGTQGQYSLRLPHERARRVCAGNAQVKTEIQDPVLAVGPDRLSSGQL